MSTWVLVIIALNAQGHDIYRDIGKFPTRQACEIRAGQLMLHSTVKGTLCVEQYDSKPKKEPAS